MENISWKIYTEIYTDFEKNRINTSFFDSR
jgi:hypothetical protein